ncbi:hypothetical protein DFH09DRAFT_1092298 [Mycena vulgaris]|nr:hypothetical protein DFH09DRAFT_1092298 [Mycena vulgaris]
MAKGAEKGGKKGYQCESYCILPKSNWNFVLDGGEIWSFAEFWRVKRKKPIKYSVTWLLPKMHYSQHCYSGENQRTWEFGDLGAELAIWTGTWDFWYSWGKSRFFIPPPEFMELGNLGWNMGFLLPQMNMRPHLELGPVPDFHLSGSGTCDQILLNACLLEEEGHCLLARFLLHSTRQCTQLASIHLKNSDKDSSFRCLDGCGELIAWTVLNSVELVIKTFLNLGICVPCQTALTTKTLQSHFTSQHVGTMTAAVKKDVYDILIQNWLPPPRSRCLLIEWEKHLPADLPNAQMISPWLMLMRTGWHEHVQPFKDEIPELRHLVSMPSPRDKMYCLHDRVKEYLTNAMVLLDATDELVLQHLNSPDPDKKGINNTLLHAHYQGEETLAGYVVLRKSPSQQESSGMNPQDHRAEQVGTQEGGGGPGSGIREDLPAAAPVNQRAVGQ